jgi:hypothetical protein
MLSAASHPAGSDGSGDSHKDIGGKLLLLLLLLLPRPAPSDDDNGGQSDAKGGAAATDGDCEEGMSAELGALWWTIEDGGNDRRARNAAPAAPSTAECATAIEDDSRKG